MWFVFELNFAHDTVLLTPHFPSIELSVHRPETDSLITSNIAPMFPAFKGETAVQMGEGSWFPREMHELKMPKPDLLRGFIWEVNESFWGERELNDLINSGTEEMHGTRSYVTLCFVKLFMFSVGSDCGLSVLISHFSSKLYSLKLIS